MSVDHILAAAGLGLACASAALPWHVWSNPSAYGPPRLALERLDDDPALAAMLRGRLHGPSQLLTGSTAPVKKQAAPRVVYATATYALARFADRAELALLRPGSKLGGGDSVARIAMHDGRWALLTARGHVFSVRP